MLGAPVVDIDGTFFIQAGIFIALVVVLTPALFKPWLATRARRAEAIEGAQTKAVALRDQATSLVADYDQRLAKAREQGNEVRAAAYRDEDAKAAGKLAEIRSAAALATDAERSRIVAQAEQARTELGEKVEELAQTIANKLLGRTT